MGGRALTLFALLSASMVAGCVSLSQPGHYDPPPAAKIAERRSPLKVGEVSFSMQRGPGVDVARALQESFAQHLVNAGVFEELGEGESPRVLLEGSIVQFCQPTTIFKDPYQCVDLDSFGYSGMNALLTMFTLGAWPAVTLLGVPTDWARGAAELSIVVFDPPTRIELARFDSGTASELAFAGIYYSGSPLGNSFRKAAEDLIAVMRTQLPAIEERVARIERQSSELSFGEALEAKDAAVRARALLAVRDTKYSAFVSKVAARATDEHPRVRRVAVDALLMLGGDDPAAKGALELLAKDNDDDVRSAAIDARKKIQYRALAAAVVNAEVGQAVALVEVPETRAAGLTKLRELGNRARPALDVLLFVLEGAEPADRRAIVEVIQSIGTFDARVRAALKKEADAGLREAQLSLAQLDAQDAQPAQPAQEPPPAPEKPAQEHGPLVAVFNIDAAMLKAAERNALTDVFSALLTSIADFRVVPRDAIKQRLATAKLASYRACVDESCQIELGKALAAEKVLNTKVIRQDSGCLTTATLYDLRTEASERAAVAKSACTTSDLTRAMTALAKDLDRSR